MLQGNSYVSEFACFATLELLRGEHCTRREGEKSKIDYTMSLTVAIKYTSVEWVEIHSHYSDGKSVGGIS